MQRGATAAGGLPLTGAPDTSRARLARVPWWRIAPTLVAAVLALLFLVTDPRPVDLAAHTFRAELFGQEGFSIWNGQWYAGHHTPSYSVLAPALAWLIGPALMGALSAVASAALFEQLAHRLFGDRALFGALWFGAGTATMLFSGRVTFALGVAIGLAALLALERGRTLIAVLVGLLCALASPVAALFLALAGVAVAAASGERRAPLALAAAALGPPLLFALAFPEGGEHPFPFSSYVAIPLFGLACLLLTDPRERAIRIGAVLYVAGGTAAFLIATPVGGNSVRLGALFGGPVLACALAARGTKETLLGRLPRNPRVAAIVLILAALAWWQVEQAIEDVSKVSGDPAADASYYAPLLSFLDRQAGPFRVEIPFTRSHWEAAEVAPRFALARGWERQLDTRFNELFYEGELDDRSYRRWLADNGVRFVALPDAVLDEHGEEEGRLVASDPPYLRLRWRSPHWRVYETTGPGLVENEEGANLELASMSADELRLRVRQPGSAIVKVRWSPYWRAADACVERAGDWTRVEARRSGAVWMTMSFSPGRSLSHGRRCG